MKPKAEYADKLLKTKDNILVREFAKILCDEGFTIGEKKLYAYLRNNKFLMNNNEPYQRYLDNKTFVVNVKIIETPFGEKQTRTTKITPSGQLFLFKKIMEGQVGIQV
jgi:phage antirepressor YoqD-like protein